MARPEITGKKTTTKRQRRDLSKVPPAVYSIQEFCDAHRLSRAKFYELRAQEKTPVEMIVGGRRYISLESAKHWRRERERETAKQDRPLRARKAESTASNSAPA